MENVYYIVIPGSTQALSHLSLGLRPINEEDTQIFMIHEYIIHDIAYRKDTK
jgi:hypothetical protein